MIKILSSTITFQVKLFKKNQVYESDKSNYFTKQETNFSEIFSTMKIDWSQNDNNIHLFVHIPYLYEDGTRIEFGEKFVLVKIPYTHTQ